MSKICKEYPSEIVLSSDEFRIKSIITDMNRFIEQANLILDCYKKELSSFKYQLSAQDLLEALQLKKKLETGDQVFDSKTLIRYFLTQEILRNNEGNSLKINWQQAFSLYTLPDISKEFKTALANIFNIETDKQHFEAKDDKIIIKEHAIKKIEKSYSEVLENPEEIKFFVDAQEKVKELNDLIKAEWTKTGTVLNRDASYIIDFENGNLILQKFAVPRIYRERQQAMAAVGIGGVHADKTRVNSAHMEKMLNPSAYPGVNF